MGRGSRARWAVAAAVLAIMGFALRRCGASHDDPVATPGVSSEAKVTTRGLAPKITGAGGTAGLALDLDQLQLPLEQRAKGSLVGRIRFEDGRVPAAIVVDLGAPYGAVTREGARFRIADVPAGAHPLRLTGPEFLPSNMIAASVFADQETDVGDIVVVAGRGLRGRVVDTSGKPVANANVVVGERLGCDGALSGELFEKSATTTRYFGRGAVASTDADGRFSLANLIHERLVVVGEQADLGRSRPTPIDAGDGTREVTLVLEPFAGVRGHVKGGDAGARARVRATQADAPDVSCTVDVDADGAFHIDRLTAGPYIVGAERVGSPHGDRVETHERRAEVALRAGTAVQVELDLGLADGVDLEVQTEITASFGGAMTRHALFRGAAFDGNQAELEAHLVRSNEAWQTTGSTGRAVITHVPPGSYTLCTVVFPQMTSTVAIEYVRENAMELPVYCRALEITASPPQQLVQLTLPAPPLP